MPQNLLFRGVVEIGRSTLPMTHLLALRLVVKYDGYGPRFPSTSTVETMCTVLTNSITI